MEILTCIQFIFHYCESTEERFDTFLLFEHFAHHTLVPEPLTRVGGGHGFHNLWRESHGHHNHVIS